MYFAKLAERFIVVLLNTYDGGELSIQIDNYLFCRFREKCYRAYDRQLHRPIDPADARATFNSTFLTGFYGSVCDEKFANLEQFATTMLSQCLVFSYIVLIDMVWYFIYRPTVSSWLQYSNYG